MSRLSFAFGVGDWLSKYTGPRFGPLMRSRRVAQLRKIPSSNDGETRASTLADRPWYSISNVVEPVVLHWRPSAR